MQPRGLPIHPSLLPGSHPNNNLVHVPGQNHGNAMCQPNNIGAMAAHALTSSLANPYGSTSNYSYTNANYHSYFTQPKNFGTTAQGYTLSSTYVPQSADSRPTSWPQVQYGRIQNSRVSNYTPRRLEANSFSISGNIKCTHTGCSFSGSKKTVEIHMMDRHLIFPPGWKTRQNDWDADPSLKGKPVPIPGTGVILNTPEAIDAWIAERRKKWPTSQRVEDKKRKAQEASNRGEIDPSELTARGRKKRRFDDESPKARGLERRWGRGRGRGRSDWRGGMPDSGWRGRGRGGSKGYSRSETGDGATHTNRRSEGHEATSSHEESSDSGSDMNPIKDAISSKTPINESELRIFEDVHDASQKVIRNADILADEHVASSHNPSNPLSHGSRPLRRQRLAQPKVPPNPFASRPSLLRNLLLPEIRHTISNLSQAIHFLVENDFLEGVELKPGDHDTQRIKVLASASIAAHSGVSETSLPSDNTRVND